MVNAIWSLAFFAPRVIEVKQNLDDSQHHLRTVLTSCRQTGNRCLYLTATSVISRPLSIIANASRNSASVIHSGGLVKKVFQRTNVYRPCWRKYLPRACISGEVPLKGAIGS